MITEDQLEQHCLDWFRDVGYEYANGYDIAHDGDVPEREDYKQVLLTGRFLDALRRINLHIPVATLEERLVHVLIKRNPFTVDGEKASHCGDMAELYSETYSRMSLL